MRKRLGGLIIALVALVPGPVSAQTQLPDLAHATLEELMRRRRVPRALYDVIVQEPPRPTLAIVNGRPALLALSTYENGHRLDTAGGEIMVRTELTKYWDADAARRAAWRLSR